MRTRVRTRFGLVQGMCRVPGITSAWGPPDLTAAAGPVLAVDRPQVPGARRLRPDLLPRPDRGPRPRLPGLDGRLAGAITCPSRWPITAASARSGRRSAAPAATAWRVRNSLIFAWKNLSGRRLAAHLAWLPVRLAHALATRRADLRRRAGRGGRPARPGPDRPASPGGRAGGLDGPAGGLLPAVSVVIANFRI